MIQMGYGRQKKRPVGGRWIAVACYVLLSGALSGCATESVMQRQIAQQIATARTSADHEALAAWFDSQADEADASAERHRGMKEHYVRWDAILSSTAFGPTGNRAGSAGFWQQCEKLVRLYAQASEENRTLAKMHREIAAGAKLH